MVNKYLKKQCNASMFNFEHHTVSDFCLSCWQQNRSALPLLCVRTVIFLGCLGILLASMILTGMSMNLGYWFIYMTHWGLVLNTMASCFAVFVSLRAYQYGSLEASFELPWYVKAFWVFYDIAVVEAFFITIYYFTFLLPAYDEELELAVNLVLDYFIHAVNSVLMLALLMTSRHPSRLLHFIYPVGFGIFYLLFTVVYHFAGGTDPFGNKYIYPTLDWELPGATSIMVVVSAIALIVVHLIVVGFAACRNWLSRRYGGRRSKSVDLS